MDDQSINDNDDAENTPYADLLDQAAEIAALSQAGASDLALSSASAADKLIRSPHCPPALKELNAQLTQFTDDNSLPASISLAVASDSGHFVALPNLTFFFSGSEIAGLALAVRGSTKSKFGGLLARGGIMAMAAGLALFIGPAAVGIFVLEEAFMLAGVAFMGGGLFAYSKRNIGWTVPLANAQLGQLQRLNELLITAGVQGRMRVLPENGGLRVIIEAKG